VTSFETKVRQGFYLGYVAPGGGTRTTDTHNCGKCKTELDEGSSEGFGMPPFILIFLLCRWSINRN
jgi:hypothetical protein